MLTAAPARPVAEVRQLLAASRRGLHAQAWRLAHALRSFYRRAAELDDWHATSHAGLASAIALGDPVAEVRIRETLGSVHLESARPTEAIEQWTTTLARLAALGDALGLGRSHVSLGVAYGRLGQLETAIGHIRAALAIPEFAANPQHAAFGEMTLGVKYGELGDYDQAGQAFTRALMVARQFGDSEVICFAEHNLAELFLRAGDLAAAETHARAEIELAAQVHYPLREARGWDILGTILRDRDSGHDSAAARAAWQQALTCTRAWPAHWPTRSAPGS